MSFKLLTIFLLCSYCCFGQIELPVDFELSNTTYFTDFAGNNSAVGSDPTNSTNMVAITTRTITAEPWAGTTIGDDGFASPIPFSATNTTISLKVYSEYVGTSIHLKAEDLINPDVFVETRMYTTKSNEWETIVFDFSNPVFGSQSLNLNAAYRKLSVFFNFGTPGFVDGEQIFYWDDVAMGGVSTTLAQIDLPVTFENPTISYALVDFENNSSTIGADPDDPTNTVAITTKTFITSPWSGTIIGTRNGFVNTIPFSPTDTKIRMRVYSPDVNTPILLKAESVTNPTLTVETLQFTTKANEWEEIEWNFLQNVPNTPAINFNIDYDLLAVFFNFGIDGVTAGEKTYYWDDVVFPTTTNTESFERIEISAFPNPVTNQLQIRVNEEMTEIFIVNNLSLIHI